MIWLGGARRSANNCRFAEHSPSCSKRRCEVSSIFPPNTSGCWTWAFEAPAPLKRLSSSTFARSGLGSVFYLPLAPFAPTATDSPPPHTPPPPHSPAPQPSSRSAEHPPSSRPRKTIPCCGCCYLLQCPE